MCPRVNLRFLEAVPSWPGDIPIDMGSQVCCKIGGSFRLGHPMHLVMDATPLPFSHFLADMVAEPPY